MTFEVPVSPPEGDLDLTLSPSSLEAGENTTVEGSGFDPGETVHLVMYSDPVVLGNVVADSTGNISETITIPDDTVSGDHDILGFAADHIGSAELAVTGAIAAVDPTTTPARATVTSPSERVIQSEESALPVTGSELGRLVLAAMVLTTIGGALVITGQRRRRARV